MKKIIPYLIIPLLIVLLILLLIDNKKDVNPKAITINTDHNYLYNGNKTLVEINLYLNDSKSPLINKDAISDVVIRNLESNKVLDLELVSITSSHNETYLSENYVMYTYKFKMPNLSSNFEINNAYIDFILTNQNSYTFKIGSINLTYLINSKELNWKTIDSKKNNSNDLSISSLVIETEEEINNIELVSINNKPYNYSYINKTLIINIDTPYYISYIPVIIKTSDNIYYLNNHYYVTDYNLIERANNNLNIYELN